MSYDKDTYDQLRSLHVPHAMALALADDDNPIGRADLGVQPLALDADLETVVAKINEIISKLT